MSVEYPSGIEDAANDKFFEALRQHGIDPNQHSTPVQPIEVSSGVDRSGLPIEAEDQGLVEPRPEALLRGVRQGIVTIFPERYPQQVANRRQSYEQWRS